MNIINSKDFIYVDTKTHLQLDMSYVMVGSSGLVLRVNLTQWLMGIYTQIYNSLLYVYNFDQILNY